MNENDTIAATSTPVGVGAVGVIRMSGPGARKVLEKLWISDKNSVDKFVTHRMYYGKLSTGTIEPIDNVLAVYMASPNSYTGEDVVEIHCHGGALSTRAVLEAALGAGARLAGPGEFTRRAFLNGRMDLVQAEGVADVINATSERALRLARGEMNGGLSRVIKGIQNSLMEIKAFVEASIDFPEEDAAFIETGQISEKIEAVINRVSLLASTYKEGRLIKDGVRVVIVGRPNVGKSSILNAILGAERAIVHHTPGTTRDTIEETIQLDGVAFHLIDTAGLHDSLCEVERMGMERAKIKLSEADMAIVVLDAVSPFDASDAEILEMTSAMDRVIVLNKKDLLRTDIDEQTFDFDKTTKKLMASAVTGDGIDSLRAAMVEFVAGGVGEGEGVTITNLRHKVALAETVLALKNARVAALDKESAEFIAYHLQAAMDSLSKITGEITTDDVLNGIFSRFCIGK